MAKEDGKPGRREPTGSEIMKRPPPSDPIETGAQVPGPRRQSIGDEFQPYPPKQLRELVIPDMTQELQRLQKHRKSLPPLPKFPDADLIRARWEELTSRPDPSEKGRGNQS